MIDIMVEKNPDLIKVGCSTHLEGKASKVVIEDSNCNFLKDDSNPPLFIIGFTGVGMIGTIVANELITQLKMKQIGFVLSEDLPPITVFYDGILKHPFRIYYDEKYNIVVSICEVPFQQGSYRDLARTLMGWALNVGIQDVICFQGMADDSVFLESPAPVYAAAEKEILDKILIHGVKKPPKGLIMGAEAALLNEMLNNKLNGVVYLTPANPQIPAPEGAATIIEKVAEVYNFPIDLQNLRKEGNEIKQRLFELQKQTNNIHQQPGRPSSSHNLYS